MTTADAKPDRQARLAAALRANLRRRKDQDRARQATAPDRDDDSDDDEPAGGNGA